METVCIRLEEGMAKRLDSNIKKMGYGTKTEFVREAIRNKLEADEKERLIKEFLSYKGKAENQTSSKQNKATAEEVFKQIAKERGWNI